MAPLIQDDQAAVMDRLVWEPCSAEMLSGNGIKQVTHCKRVACASLGLLARVFGLSQRGMGQCNSVTVLAASCCANEPLWPTLQSWLQHVSSLALLCRGNVRPVKFAGVCTTQHVWISHSAQQGDSEQGDCAHHHL